MSSMSPPASLTIPRRDLNVFLLTHLKQFEEEFGRLPEQNKVSA